MPTEVSDLDIVQLLEGLRNQLDQGLTAGKIIITEDHYLKLNWMLFSYTELEDDL